MPREEPGELLSVEGRDVKVTHPEKPYFVRDVKLTKLEVVQYYLCGRERSGRRDSRSAGRAQALRQWRGG